MLRGQEYKEYTACQSTFREEIYGFNLFHDIPQKKIFLWKNTTKRLYT